MIAYEILFEGEFDNNRLADNAKFCELNGFFALRQISANCLPDAIQQGIEIVRNELAHEDEVLVSVLTSLVPFESRILESGEHQHVTGFTFF